MKVVLYAAVVVGIAGLAGCSTVTEEERAEVDITLLQSAPVRDQTETESGAETEQTARLIMFRKFAFEGLLKRFAFDLNRMGIHRRLMV